MVKSRLEREFQLKLIKRLKDTFPGIHILKNDSSYRQGIPDLTLFYNDRWAVLEVKQSATADERPNQGYYVDMLNAMSYAAFIYPENEEDIFDDLQQAFRSRRTTRVSKRK